MIVNRNWQKISKLSSRFRHSMVHLEDNVFNSPVYRNSYDGILVVDEKQTVRFSNPSIQATYGGKDPDSLIGRQFYEIFLPQYQETAVSLMELFCFTRQNTQPLEAEILNAANVSVPVYFWFAGECTSHRSYSFLYIRDISHWKKAQKELAQVNFDLADAYRDTLEGWGRALELRDHETEGHTKRVTDWTIRLAMAMNMSIENLTNIRYGAMLHDIGKMGIPDSILLKPGPLDEDEWKIMRMHPIYARDMLSQINFLKSAITIPYFHHEKWDGTGYPTGLKGKGIPIEARIFSVVDVWFAWLSVRPYRTGWPKEKVIQYIRDNEGIYFDPEIAEIFIDLQK